jgi:DEAD/DEAH box helicase domain-containing protein
VEQKYFSEMVDTLATRAGHATVSWLGFSNVALRRHLLDVFSRGYGNTGSFVADPSFEAVFGWKTADKTMSDLSGSLLDPSLVKAMDEPDPELSSEYRFSSDRQPYLHQLTTWELLSPAEKNSVVVTSGTGSGKTECFMVPILNRLIQQQRSVRVPLLGVRALFLYPLNALINSQRDRLRAWTYGLTDSIRFCLYNGMTPDVLPVSEAQIGSEIRDRRTLRKTPPPILVTNATMLEYMLVRTQDSPILEASKGKLEWIILDEAHTYIGSQAAELALLIRRVLHAFGVRPQDVRFVATSATIGDPKGAVRTQLREFLARVSGNDIERVHVVSGERTIPEMPADSVGRGGTH